MHRRYDCHGGFFFPSRVQTADAEPGGVHWMRWHRLVGAIVENSTLLDFCILDHVPKAARFATTFHLAAPSSVHDTCALFPRCCSPLKCQDAKKEFPAPVKIGPDLQPHHAPCENPRISPIKSDHHNADQPLNTTAQTPATEKLAKLPTDKPPTSINPINPPPASRSSFSTHTPAAIMQQLPNHPLLIPNKNCTTTK